MKTRNTEMLVSLMELRKQINNVDLYSSEMLFDYNKSMELVETCIEITKMNIIAEFKNIEMRDYL